MNLSGFFICIATYFSMRRAFLQRSFFCLLHIAASRNAVSFVSLPTARVKASCGQEERLRPNETFPT